MPSSVHGAGGCPRAAGHEGDCYWWLPWEDGTGAWRVIVYSGEPQRRRRRCKGVFVDEPRLSDVARLLRTIAPMKRREVARRTPVSEPALHAPRPMRVGRSRFGHVAELAGG
jgi:hypothetical protein